MTTERSLREISMLTAADLKEGMTIRTEGQIYRVLAAESKAGAAKLSGVVKTKLSNVRSGHTWEAHFRPQERLEEVQLERRIMEFVFAAGDTCTFMSPETFEQLEVPKAILGPTEKFLQPGMQLPVEFLEGEPLTVAFPEVVEVLVAETAPPAHAQQETAWKEAKLENGLHVQVPMFVGPGETLRVEVKTGRYIERVRAERKRGA
jgi:elongation factor P